MFLLSPGIVSTPSLGPCTPSLRIVSIPSPRPSSPRNPLEKGIGKCWGLNTNTLTVDIYSNSLRKYSASLFMNICSSMSTGTSYGFPSPTWRCTTLTVPFSPSKAYYPLLNEISNSWIFLRKITNPPSTTPLVVESRYKSSFYHVLSGRVTLHLFLPLYYWSLLVRVEVKTQLLSSR